MTPNEIDDLIKALLRGDVVAWPPEAGEEIQDLFVHRARYHGVSALLHDRWSPPSNWPQKIFDALRLEALGRGMWELRHQHVLGRLITALAERGVAPLLFKGTALAYDLYPNPVWRSRGDTDILVAAEDIQACREVLAAQGFERGFALPGEDVSYQDNWTLMASEGSAHSIDLHRRINNSELLSQLFTYDELRSSCRPISSLCSGAVAVSHVHALLLACMHRAVHKQCPYYADGIAHYSGDRLIWLYDILLVSKSLTESEWGQFLHLAQSKGLAGTCLDGLQQTRQALGATTPEFVMSGLSVGPSQDRASAYLSSSEVRQVWLNFRAIEGLSRKAAFLKEVVFPPEAYMREKYADANTGVLFRLYARRAFAGVAKRFQRRRQTS